MVREGKRPFRAYLFSSFFAAAMVAATYAYFQWTYSRFNTIDFSQWIFYDASGVFEPEEERYTVLIYSSRQEKLDRLLTKFDTVDPVLAVDLSQERFTGEGARNLTAGINTLLPLINRFHVTKTPVLFSIERKHKELYIQRSRLLEL